MDIEANIPGSSNGRTSPFGGENHGSNPCSGAKFASKLGLESRIKQGSCLELFRVLSLPYPFPAADQTDQDTMGTARVTRIAFLSPNLILKFLRILE